MTLMTYRPRISIFDEFNKIFNGINAYDSSKLYNSIWQPAFDITEDDKNYYVSFDLPGINRKNVDISISNDILSIAGLRESDSGHNENYSRFNQVRYGKFEKSFYLPDSADQDSIKAKMENGVLALTIRKIKEVSDNIKKISIK